MCTLKFFHVTRFFSLDILHTSFTREADLLPHRSFPLLSEKTLYNLRRLVPAPYTRWTVPQTDSSPQVVVESIGTEKVAFALGSPDAVSVEDKCNHDNPRVDVSDKDSGSPVLWKRRQSEEKQYC